MLHVATWWLIAELLGIIALPLTLSLFKNLPDRGYGLSKALGLLLVSYLFWLAGLSVLPNSRLTIILVMLLLALVSGLVLRRKHQEIRDFLRENRSLIIVSELLFAGLFILWAVMRSHNPEIHDTEKPMDFALLNGILRSPSFPPHDPWLSGHFMSYYYFGYLMSAVLIKFSGVASSIGFNLSLAFFMAITGSVVFSLVYNLVKLCRGSTRAGLGFGLVGVALLLFVGNLEGSFELAYAHGAGSTDFWHWLGIEGLSKPYHSPHWYPDQFWWWWRATRVIGTHGADYTITEFPFFSYLLGDLHAHLMALPFGLMTLALGLNILASKEALGLGWLRKNLPCYLLMVVCLGAIGFLHTWDLPTYLLLFLAVMLLQIYLRRGLSQPRQWVEWLALAAIALVGVFLFYLPYYLNIESGIKGIGLWRGPDSRLVHFTIIWGMFLFAGVSLALFWLRRSWRSVSWVELGGIVLVVLLPWAIWSILRVAISPVTGGVEEAGHSVSAKLWHLFPWMAILSIVLVAALASAKRSRDEGKPGILFVLLLLSVALLLTMGVELFYVVDAFSNRMNTVFRLYYEAWAMMAIAVAFGIYYLLQHWQPHAVLGKLVRISWWGILGLLLAVSLIYPVAAAWSHTHDTAGPSTLDGLAFVNTEEREALDYLWTVPGSSVIVEATGGAYSDYGRVSSRTGLATILGWGHHEMVWRGSAEALTGRAEDIDRIYTAQDQNLVKSLLLKYKVSYVYVGGLEREKYGPGVAERLSTFMDSVFDNGEVVIFRVR